MLNKNQTKNKEKNTNKNLSGNCHTRRMSNAQGGQTNLRQPAVGGPGCGRCVGSLGRTFLLLPLNATEVRLGFGFSRANPHFMKTNEFYATHRRV